MQVVATDKLIAYLRKKDARAILLDVAECKSCGGAIGELYARPCKQAEVERLLSSEEPSRRAFPCVDEAGELVEIGGEPLRLIVERRAIKIENEVRLELKRVLGIPDVKVVGATF